MRVNFGCGHPREVENIAVAGGRAICRTCHRKRNEHDHLVYRVRMLPKQLESAREKVKRLEAEALRLGLTDLVEAA